MKKSFLLQFVLVAGLVFQGFGQIPPGYYNAVIGLSGQPLQSGLHNIIDNHTVMPYSSLYACYTTTDAKPGNVVWDMYSDIPGGTPPYLYHFSSGDECGNYNSEGDCYNREHSWPKSWFGDHPPMNSDLFHIYPTDGWVNNKRDNDPYGEVGNATWTSLNGSKVGTCSWPGYSGVVFEPIDEYKGDFARTYFYMSTRYYGEDSGWPGSPMTTGAQLKPWALQMMLVWHKNDPVSQKEIDRNNAVYAYQINRNPFIDHPEFATDIWGFPVGIDETNSAPAKLEVYPNPASDFCNIDLPSGIRTSNYHLSLVSMNGTRFSQEITLNGNTLNLSVQSLSPGFYFLILASDAGTWHGKLMKE